MVDRSDVSGSLQIFFNRNELLTTTSELVTISRAAMIGCSAPDMASGSAMRLYEKAQTRFWRDRCQTVSLIEKRNLSIDLAIKCDLL